MLFYPITDANFDTPSYLAYQEGYFLTREAMKWFWDNDASNGTNRKEPTVSPLQDQVLVLLHYMLLVLAQPCGFEPFHKVQPVNLIN